MDTLMLFLGRGSALGLIAVGVIAFGWGFRPGVLSALVGLGCVAFASVVWGVTAALARGGEPAGAKGVPRRRKAAGGAWAGVTYKPD